MQATAALGGAATRANGRNGWEADTNGGCERRVLIVHSDGEEAMTKPTRVLALGLAAVALTSAAPPQTPTPIVIAGIDIPRTPLSLKAETYVQSLEPDYLFNHSVRTYLFGALRLGAKHIMYDPETGYVAALFHDAGLVPTIASPNASFEIDGADKAEQFVKANGGSSEQARTVWNAIVTHDMGRAYQRHQSPEALLLGEGVGVDVDGDALNALSPAIVGEILRAYPRRDFKRRFTAAAVDHCRRKPTSQMGWLDPLCRKIAPNVDRGDVEKEIASAPFPE